MTSTIILKADSKLKQKAQQTAGDLGLTLTSVINGYLSDFVESKKITFQTKKTNKKYVDPYGIFAGANITEDDIDSITKSWMKKIDEI
ncbi:MAG: hypothetical protein AAB778_01765 [Patescibacteria group bacterium]